MEAATKEKDSKQDRWRKFSIANVAARDFKLDSFEWIKDKDFEDADDLPEPEELVSDALEELQAAVSGLTEVLASLENGNGATASAK